MTAEQGGETKIEEEAQKERSRELLLFSYEASLWKIIDIVVAGDLSIDYTLFVVFMMDHRCLTKMDWRGGMSYK